MFALFFSLYNAMFTGGWTSLSLADVRNLMLPITKEVGTFITSIFGDNQMTTFGATLFAGTEIQGSIITGWVVLVSFILALITSIGIVVLAVKGIKRIFSVFFTFGR